MFEQGFEDFITKLFEGVYIVDTTRKIIFWNKGAEQITGFKAKEVVNKHCYQDILKHVDEHGKNLCHDGCPLLDTIKTNEVREANVYLHHKSGYRVPVSIKSMPLHDSDGKVIGAVEVFTDSRYRQDKLKENRELKELLLTDPLTNIYNRRYLDFHLDNMVKEVEQFDTTFGVLFFDIDDFKKVNDTYGHTVGDGVLKTIATTIKSNIRSGDVVGRFGGEEFICVLRNVSERELLIVSEKLRLLCSGSEYRHDQDILISVTVSIGGTNYVKGEEINEMIERADTYLYESKHNGKNQSTIK